MYTKTRFTLTILALATMLFVGCAAPTPESVEIEVTRVVEKEGETVVEQVMVTAAPALAPTATPAANIPSGSHTSVRASQPNRLIVKNAELRLLVTDTDVAIDRTTQIVADTGGYIIGSRIRYNEWLGKNYKYASITLGVPVDQFELAMRRLRSLALRVEDETASGQDVTDEYVDLQSRLGNLKATRDRIREFLDQARTVEESLKVNEQLSAIEEQIEQVQGRMNHLFDRAAYSTITVQIDPELPQPTPSPTPAPTPTPTPIPPWTPTQTIEQASYTLGSILRALTEIAIWFIIVVAPLLAPPALIVWAVQRRIKRKDIVSEEK
jgi:hypothetical protein